MLCGVISVLECLWYRHHGTVVYATIPVIHLWHNIVSMVKYLWQALFGKILVLE